MSSVAVRVEKIGKKFHIGRRQEKYRTLRDAVADAFVAPFRKAGKLLRGQATGAAGLDEIIWALRDVSFEVKDGEIVGIIGRNGSGKSTLLKILSRITEPTNGFAEICGRVGSLLEVGTGFHPELTGRENIYLNGAILGMKRTEINRKFDEIVAFAEVEKFIDTPVKHYSSGMYLRLAFSVAAHLEPEILLVDEVLAVGDANFQRKCLDKMHDVGKEGRTVIFVSHNMPAVTNLCERVVLLDEGYLKMDGLSHQVVGAYLRSATNIMSVREWPDPNTAPGGEVARLRAVRVRDEEGRTASSIDIRKPVSIEMEYEVLKPDYKFLLHYNIYNEEGVCIFPAIDQDLNWRKRPRPKGRYTSRALIPGNLLRDGTLYVSAVLLTLEPLTTQFHQRDVVAFHVIDSFNGDSARADWTGPLGGVVRPYCNWTTQFSSNGD